jgi:hypothetical protein
LSIQTAFCRLSVTFSVSHRFHFKRRTEVDTVLCDLVIGYQQSDVYFPPLARSEQKYRKTDYKNESRLDDNSDTRHSGKKLNFVQISKKKYFTVP